MVRASNPSIRDYLLGYLVGNPVIFTRLANAVVWPEQVLCLIRMIEEPRQTSSSLRQATIFRKEIRDVHLKEPSVVIGACLALIGVESSIRHKMEGPRGDRMIRQQANDEYLAHSALDLAVNVASRVEIRRVIRVVVEKLLPAWQAGRGRKDSALLLLERITETGDDVASSSSRCLADASEWFENSIETAEDYSLLLDLRDRFVVPTSLSHEDIVQQFIDYAERELDSLESSYDLDEIAYEFDFIENVAAELSVTSDLEDRLESVSRHMAGLDRDDDDEGYRSGATRSDESGGDISDLFDTLR